MGKGDKLRVALRGNEGRVDDQRACGDDNRKEHKINKMGLKWGHLQHLHVSKQMWTRHHYGKNQQQQQNNNNKHKKSNPRTVSGKSAYWVACLKCLYTNACSIGNKHEELEICV